ncbi:MAG: crotonase/enoyl-CoA hydratase family protein [Planctomycetes bacterium]|nr:crotonase/enoyl-CoA hydratase family protein [Planctomycetota bacterium]
MIESSVKDGIATVTITTKTMPPSFFPACRRVFEELAEDAGLRCVVIHSSEECFSYGLDLPATFTELGPLFAGGGATTRGILLSTIHAWQASFTAIAHCPVPVIAAVHGWCVGGGLDLVSACDIRLASADAQFSLREAKVAIVADLGSLQRLPAIIGPGHTRELAYSGKDIDAQRAQEIGLVNTVHPTPEATRSAAYALAAEIAANSPLAVRGIKQVLEFGEGKPIATALEYVATWNAAFLASEDLAEAAAAFMEKRAPVYTGR